MWPKGDAWSSFKHPVPSTCTHIEWFLNLNNGGDEKTRTKKYINDTNRLSTAETWYLSFLMARFYNRTHFPSNICSEAWLKKQNTYLLPQTCADYISPEATSYNRIGIELLENCKALLNFARESIRLWTIFSMALIIYCPESLSSLHYFNSSGEVLYCTGNVSWNVQWNHLQRECEFVFHNLYIYLTRFSVLRQQIRFAIWATACQLTIRVWPPRTRNKANNVTILVKDKTYRIFQTISHKFFHSFGWSATYTQVWFI